MNDKTQFNIVVLASGRGSNFKALAQHFQNHSTLSQRVQIKRLITDKPEAPALSLASNFNIPSSLIQAKGRGAAEFFEELRTTVAAENPDLVVLAGFMRILSPKFIAAFKHKIINIHPSLLPDFKGLNAQAQALKAGVTIAGCTVHIVEEEIDSGGILGQARVSVLPNDSLENLEQRILAQEHKLLPAVVEMLVKQETTIGKNGEIRGRILTISGEQNG